MLNKRDPSPNSTGIIFVLSMGFLLIKNSAIVDATSSVSNGLMLAKPAKMNSPFVDVRMQVLSTLQSNRSGVAKSRNLVQVNWRSINGVAP